MKNTIKVIVCVPGRTPETREIENTLETFQSIVDGYIQILNPYDDGTRIVCNEDGKLLGLLFNRPIFNEHGGVYDVIAGTFITVRAPENSDDFDSLTDEQIKHYTALYQKCIIDEREERGVWIY